jgi:hypothetical protein
MSFNILLILEPNHVLPPFIDFRLHLPPLAFLYAIGVNTPSAFSSTAISEVFFPERNKSNMRRTVTAAFSSMTNLYLSSLLFSYPKSSDERNLPDPRSSAIADLILRDISLQ